ncbi:hypothetical protein Tco_1293677 [Tanacetum coccineum]
MKNFDEQHKGFSIGYGFLPFSFSSLGELEKDAVTLLKRICKFSVTQDIGARAAIHIFNRINFSIAKGVGGSAYRGLDVCVDLAGSLPLTQTGLTDFLPGRAVVDAAHHKRVKYEAKCADIGYGFLPFPFSSFGELEKDAVTLLKRLRKFTVAQDIGVTDIQQKDKNKSKRTKPSTGMEECMKSKPKAYTSLMD